MQVPTGFNWYEVPTKEIIALLSKTTLGTNGAKYRHLDTPERIYQVDNPLFLALQWRDKVLGNITFCRRKKAWYIRYFAFEEAFQARGKSNKKKKDSRFKLGLEAFFQEQLASGAVEVFYAYIDPKNARSKWMSEQFGFRVAGQLVTQSYSRLAPKKSQRFELLSDWKVIKPNIEERYAAHQFYRSSPNVTLPYYGICDEQGQVLASGKFTKVSWKIERFPGKLGNILIKLIPFIPWVNRLIQPKKHTFLTPEGLFVLNHDPALLKELFDSALSSENCNMLVWWVDEKDPLYLQTHQRISWGILNRIIGKPKVDIVVRERETRLSSEKPFYVAALDLI